ncbi:NfeD family protein [Bacillota bacterium Meth-B3]|nr:NfeD family protein [Christensenellaceae bacterium]MEA5064682.1 NfeD family protein [Eubacteriales bacterium]MEA5070173.1 NfeD family protein [Christensenellaceae bacterium]
MGTLLQTLSSHIPAILCLVIGYALVVFEMCIPGFGVPGTLGIILLVVGIVTGTGSLAHALILAGIVIVLLLIALPICLRFIGKGGFLRSKLVLNDTSVPVRDAGRAPDRHLNREGTALTALRPAGMGQFGDEKLNIVSGGAFIPEGARVKVVRVAGNRVVVEEIKA